MTATPTLGEFQKIIERFHQRPLDPELQNRLRQMERRLSSNDQEAAQGGFDYGHEHRRSSYPSPPRAPLDWKRHSGSAEDLVPLARSGWPENLPIQGYHTAAPPMQMHSMNPLLPTEAHVRTVDEVGDHPKVVEWLLMTPLNHLRNPDDPNPTRIDFPPDGPDPSSAGADHFFDHYSPSNPPHPSDLHRYAAEFPTQDHFTGHYTLPTPHLPDETRADKRTLQEGVRLSGPQRTSPPRNAPNFKPKPFEIYDSKRDVPESSSGYLLSAPSASPEFPQEQPVQGRRKRWGALGVTAGDGDVYHVQDWAALRACDSRGIQVQLEKTKARAEIVARAQGRGKDDEAALMKIVQAFNTPTSPPPELHQDSSAGPRPNGSTKRAGLKSVTPPRGTSPPKVRKNKLRGVTILREEADEYSAPRRAVPPSEMLKLMNSSLSKERPSGSSPPRISHASPERAESVSRRSFSSKPGSYLSSVKPVVPSHFVHSGPKKTDGCSHITPEDWSRIRTYAKRSWANKIYSIEGEE